MLNAYSGETRKGTASEVRSIVAGTGNLAMAEDPHIIGSLGYYYNISPKVDAIQAA